MNWAKEVYDHVANWEIWEKEISEFPTDFDETETAYILEGEILVTPEGGDPVQILPHKFPASRTQYQISTIYNLAKLVESN